MTDEVQIAAVAASEPTPLIGPCGRVWHLCIGGFTQVDYERSGLFKLWQKMGVHRGPHTHVNLYTWKSRMSEIAEQIWLASDEDDAAPRVFVYCYSYGAGYAFPKLAKALGDRGIDIEVAVLCDPVRRWLLLKWLSLSAWFNVWVPDNVKTVWWFYQRRTRPQGHPVVAVDPKKTQVHPGVQLFASHIFVDDAPAYHKKSLEVAAAA